MLMLTAGCSTTTTLTKIQDVGQQAVLYESARAPHLKGPGLRGGQVQMAANYNVSHGPKSSGLRTPGGDGTGGVVSQQSWDVRFATAISEPDKSTDAAWEFGVNIGLSHSAVAKSMAEAVELSSLDDVYFRGGFGLRGPLMQNEGFVFGLSIEAEFSALPFHVEVVRNTAQLATTHGSNVAEQVLSAVFLGHAGSASTFTIMDAEVTVQRERHTGLAFFPTIRGGFYSGYEFNSRMALSFGASLQNTPAVKGVATQSYSCKDVSHFTVPDRQSLAKKCREKKGKDFPIIDHALAGTLYGGVHVMFDHLVLTLRAQSNLVFGNKTAYASPISGDFEVAYRF